MKSESRSGAAGLAFAPFDFSLRDGRAVTVRAAVPGDAQGLYDYMVACIPECEQTIMVTAAEFDYTPARERELLAGQETALGDLWLLAWVGETVVASVNCETRKRERVVHIGEIGMTVRAAYRGQGLGTQMLAALVAWSRRHAVLERLELEVYADNWRAREMYEKQGFQEAAYLPGRIRFGEADYKDDVLMWCDVRREEQR